MASSEQLSLIKEGFKQWNSWRDKNSLVLIDLSNADLRGLDLSRSKLWGANLQSANLQGANLSNSDLRNADFRRSNLSQANFLEADLRNVDFSATNLRDTNFSKANLKGAIFSDINSQGTNFTGANLIAICLNNCLFRDIILTECICTHVYLDKNRSNRYPKENNFEPGELASFLQKDPITTTPFVQIDTPKKNEKERLLTFNIPEDKSQLKTDKRVTKQNTEYLDNLALIITTFIEEVSHNIPESPVRHVRIATKVIELLKNDNFSSETVQKAKNSGDLDKLIELIPHPATHFIVIGLKK